MWGKKPPPFCRDKCVYVCIRQRPRPRYTCKAGESGVHVRCKWVKPLTYPKGTIITDGHGGWGVVAGDDRHRKVHPMPWCTSVDPTCMHSYQIPDQYAHFFFKIVSAFLPNNLKPVLPTCVYTTDKLQLIIDAMKAYLDSRGQIVYFRGKGSKFSKMPTHYYLHPDGVSGIASNVAGNDASLWLSSKFSDMFHVSRLA